MPFKRRRSASRPRSAFKKSRRAVRKSMRRSRVKPSRSMSYAKAINQHMYSRYASTPADYSLTGTELDVSETFQFDAIAGYSEFSSLYDRYRITAVQTIVTLLNNPSSFLKLNGALNEQQQTNWYPKLWYVHDYDDSSTLTLAAMRERANVKSIVIQPNKTYRLMSRPAILTQTYRTSTTTGYSPKWRQWIDMANANVPHYGLKWILDTQGLDPTDTSPFRLHVEYKYFFTCKDVL